MSYSNYQVRNTCFKMKNNNPPKFPEIVAEIEAIKGNLSWNDFAESWDVVVKNGKIEIFQTIKNLPMISEVCAKKHMAVTMKVSPDWTPEESSIIHMVECQFLENKMNWSNYKTVWRVVWNEEQKRVVTDIIKKIFVQNEVTEEQINNQLMAAMDKSKIAKEVVNQLEVREMTEAERIKYSKLLINTALTPPDIKD